METKAIEANNTTFLFGAKFSADASYVIAGDGRCVVCMLLGIIKYIRELTPQLGASAHFYRPRM